MATISIFIGAGISKCNWYFYGHNGNLVSSGTAESGETLTKDSAISTYFIRLAPVLKTNYTNAVFHRSDGYNQVISQDPDIYFTGDKSGTLSATYKVPGTYTITYYGNGATDGYTEPQTGSKSYTIRECEYTRTGHTFLYWVNENGTRYDPGDSVTLNTDLELYATWQAYTYTVTYNGNGSGVTGVPASQTKYWGMALTLSSAEPSWGDRTFAGWSKTSARSAAVQYYPGGTYEDNAAATLFAVWHWELWLSITSDGNTYYEYTRQAYLGETVTLPTPVSISGKTFVGWRDNTTGELYGPETTQITADRNYDLTQVYEDEVETYTVTYNGNGSGVTGVPASQTKYSNEDLILRSGRPAWSNHTFWGWSTSSARTAAVEYQPGGIYTANASTTLYAVWMCVVEFYSKGSLYFSQYARIDETITLPTPSNTATERFAGWKYNDEIYSGGARVKITTNCSFTAVWETASYVITYNGNNATSGSTASQTVQIGSSASVQTCGYRKSGQFFLYWRTASGTQYYPGNSITPSGDMTLYAQWEAKSLFYWHGSNENDSAYFAAGQPIGEALTASAWNSLYAKINIVRLTAGLTKVAFADVSAGASITATRYNIASGAINQIHNAGFGNVTPATVSTGQEIVTTLFNGGTNSLKRALNSTISSV